MKQRLTAILLLGSLLIGAAACTPATEAPPTLTPIQRDEQNSERVEPTPIDPGAYQPSSVYSMPRYSYPSELINVPGMLLYADISGAATMAYINKTTGRAFRFCFDPLCDHSSCAAKLLHLTENTVYCAGKLYAVKPDALRGGAGTSIWSVELDATSLREVYRSNGNEVKGLVAVKEYLLFTVGRTAGGDDLCILDTKTGKTKTVGQLLPPEGGSPLDIDEYFTVGDSIYFSLVGSPSLYRTDDFFATSVKLFDFMSMAFCYGDATHLYGIEAVEASSGQFPPRKLFRMSLADGTVETVFDPGTSSLRIVGLDEEYCYFVYYNQNVNTGLIGPDGKPLINKPGGKLYAVPKAGGQPPKVIFDDKFYSVDYAARFDGVLYVMGYHYTEINLVARRVAMMGTLVDGTITRITRN